MKRTFFSFIVCLLSTYVFAQYSACYKDLPFDIKQAEVPQIPDLTVNVKDYGAVGDGLTLTTAEIQKAIDDVAQRGGGHVVIPQGIWLVTCLELKSNIDLHLERNALIQQTFDKSQYKLQKDGKRLYPCIYGNNLHDISVTGEGAIDGAGKYWRPVKRAKMSDYEWNTYVAMGGKIEDNGTLWMPYDLRHVNNVTGSSKEEEALRSDLFRPTGCNRVLVKGVSFQNSPRFTVHPCQCQNVIVDGVTARSMWNVQNADGIDLSNCRQCLVINCYVDCGDDGLCLKSGTGETGVKNGPCQDILIQDCNVIHAHGGFVFGSDIAGGMDRILVRRCMFSNTDVGLRFKSALGRGGTTSNVLIQDIVMTDIANEAILFNCGYFDNRYSASSAEKASDRNLKEGLYAPNFQDILIERVTCREAKTALKAVGIEGLNCVHGITVRNSSFFYRETPTDIDAKTTSDIKMENCKLQTFDVNNAPVALSLETQDVSSGKADKDGFVKLENPLNIYMFKVYGGITVGKNGKLGNTALRIRSKSNPSMEIIYDFAFNNAEKGTLLVNGKKESNIGKFFHDGYVYYNLKSYGKDLYIEAVQKNFPVKDYLYN